MITRLANRSKFYLEKLILRGARYQLLFIAALIVLISLVAGLLVFMMTSEFKGPAESIWWAFLRLTDPGYLGDDKGASMRIVSTIVTVLGYVLFMGALIAIMTQWLQRTMRNLESGLTPISQTNHVLILGWTNRTPTIVQELVMAGGRVKRFLRRIGASSLNIVILAEEVTTALARELQEELGGHWNEKQITFRSGTPLRIEHLRRAGFMNASRIIVPGADFLSGGLDVMDTRTIKALLSISNYGNPQNGKAFPLVVAEMLDARKIPTAKTAYKGEIEIIAGDAVISRLIAQNVRHQGLSYVYSELLTHMEGNEIFIRKWPQFNGEMLQNVTGAFPKAVLLGVLRQEEKILKPLLNPPDGFLVKEGDRMVFLARSYGDTAPVEGYRPVPARRGSPEAFARDAGERRLLILGWNHKIPTLIEEFESYANERFEIDILSLVPIAERDETMSRYDGNRRRIKFRQLQGDYTAPSDLNRINPASYDNIVFLGNSWLASNEESDARTILGYLLLRELLTKGSSKPQILIELMDPENEKLFQQRTGEVLISPLILSHILAHVAMRRELSIVFDEIFTVGGAEIYFRSATSYDLAGRTLNFSEIEEVVTRLGETALGLRSAGATQDKKGGITLNPPRDSVWTLKASDEVIVLATYTGR